ncbi:hypothetical protein PENSPDRAFT_444723 [Peniophora sp. CONT]|nr:hypothetical protein PENSPDRAFT_444723 [Peniophora sp. CONT]
MDREMQNEELGVLLKLWIRSVEATWRLVVSRFSGSLTTREARDTLPHATMNTTPSATQAGNNEEYTTLRVLTTLLEGIRPRNCQVPKHNLSDSTKTFVHLSQLLNIASPHVIAVTGTADHSTSQAFLVAPNSDSLVPAVHPYSTETLVATEVSEFDWKAMDVLSSTDKIRTLAQTLLQILRKLGSLTSTERRGFIVNAERWFLRVCWDRYRFRMTTTLKKEWAVSPFEVMGKWQPLAHDLATLRRLQYDGLVLKLSANNKINFEDMEMKVDDREIAVYFRVEQAVLWVQLISDLLCQCHEALQEKARPSDGQPIGFAESAGLLPLLSALLSFRPIEGIFTRTSLGTMFARLDRLPDSTDVEAGIESEDRRIGVYVLWR